MAWEEWKEVLLPGTQRDRHGNRFTFTRRDIAQADRNVGRMLSRGVPIPCVWEHVKVEARSSDERKAAYAKYTFGHVAGRRINDRGALELRLTGRDERDREQLLKTRFVSPKVCPGYSDSRGGEYRGATVAHVAATPTPVQYWQRPFQLSRGRPLYLSFQPEDDMADDADKGGKGGAGGGENAELSALIDALRAKGMNISDKVATLRELTIAVESAGDVTAGGGADDLGLDDDLDADAGATTGAAGGPMLMSDARAEPLRKVTRKELVGQVKALFRTGRADKPTAADLLRQVGAVSLSFTNGGELVPNKLVARIEALGTLKPWSAWKPNGKVDDSVELSVTELDGPGEVRGAGKDAAGAADWLMNGYRGRATAGAK